MDVSANVAHERAVMETETISFSIEVTLVQDVATITAAL